MGRFETNWLASDEQFTGLSGQWIDCIHGWRLPRSIVLDMDSTASPTRGNQKGTPYNGQFACTSLERSALPPGNVHSADGWKVVLEPVVARYGERDLRHYFGADAAFANREATASTRSGCRQTSSCRTGSPFCSRAPLGARRSRSGEPTPASASGGKLDDAARRRGQRRVHPGELELYPEVGFIVTICHIIRAGNAIMRARLSYCSFAADAVRLQLHALADNLANFMWTLALP